MVRIPPERGKASRMELRLGDASANPYLAIAGVLAAAYLGIRDKLEPSPHWRAMGMTRGRPTSFPVILHRRSTPSRRMPTLPESSANGSLRPS